MTDTMRLAEAVRLLADGANDRHLRTQLHALAALVERLEPSRPQQRGSSRTLELEVEQAIDAGDERRAIAAAHRLAVLERARVGEIDWTAMSGG